ncbi:putative wall-associated receptor kinase, galacturonan-binding domain-containing protein [Rosa chinensis]|uniref:Putative wall-associated receptor kinase, galacturonan-binding domain-containing protein n=1 Tax=Rosa chinensis TaxID=74649 RepID=A0A2P6RCR5_ROSCH|nr:putative wall-associated receptor kinase, galacturonan-binding domain-containing protein [Rosa chinensis]
MAILPAGRLQIMHLSFLVVLAAAQTQTPQVKLNCPEHCGDVPISYPFGIGADCYLRPEFNITCDQLTTPPSPKFSNSTFTFPVRITNFSHGEGELQVIQDVARVCYNTYGFYEADMSTNSTLELPPPYTISHKNKFFAVGCNSVAVYQGYQSKVPDPEESYKGGYTVSRCLDALGTALPTNSCNGFGCGLNPFPSGLQNMSVELYTLDSAIRWWNHWNLEPDYLCSYGFIVQDDNSQIRQY